MIDLILLHPPTIYDFRKKNILFGPIADVIPSTPVFEMYPLGFVSLTSYLEKRGFKVRIINIALKMLLDQGYDVEKEIKNLNPKAFGIDLHWLPHCHGGLRIAEIVKKYHPETPIIFGGLSATYYHLELIKYPQVDFVVRGDSAEEPLFQLLKSLKNKGDFSSVPNLTYKEKGEVKTNQLSWVPSDLNHINIDYSQIASSVRRDKDFWGYVPFYGWETYPILSALTCRGCTYNCPSCGGSASFYNQFCKRKRPAYRDPEQVLADIKLLNLLVKGPVFVIGDICQLSEDYAQKLLSLIKKQRIQNHFVFEFFKLPEPEFVEKIKKHVKNFNVQLSPETHDQNIRPPFRSYFENKKLEETINLFLNSGCNKVDLFFMIGLTGQTYNSVLQTIDYCDYLLGKFNKKPIPFIAPLAPFVDPGSLAFENPEEHGYKIFYKRLEEHKKALEMPSWKYWLNYETNWMTREQIVDVTYKSAEKLNQIKFKHGLISEKRFEQTKTRIENSLKALEQIDKFVKNNCNKIEGRRNHVFTPHYPTICEKDELRWPVIFSGIKLPQTVVKTFFFIIRNILKIF